MQTHITQAPIPAAVIPAFSPDRWLFQLFSPLAVAAGGPLRCYVAEMEANIGRERFLQEVKLRGYRTIEDGGKLTLILKREPLRVMI